MYFLVLATNLRVFNNLYNNFTIYRTVELYSALRRAMDQQWKYLSVGASEWSSSFQQILQCGMRRIIPLEHIQTYMIQHTTNKAQKRRLRRELLNMTDWFRVIIETL